MPSQMTMWEPVTLREAMDRLFEQSFIRPFDRSGRERDGRIFQLPVDAYTTEDAVVIEAALPGVDPNTVDITVDGDVLTISAEVPSPSMEGRSYALNERFYGTLRRALNLNVPVQADKAEATFENGVLTLRLPKSEEMRPKKITVQPR
jgi:HSP20 family protein